MLKQLGVTHLRLVLGTSMGCMHAWVWGTEYPDALDASYDYDPSPKLERVRARVTAINFADDPINPPELGILEQGIKRVPHGKALVLPATTATHGRSNHTWAQYWKGELVALLSR